MAMYVFPHGVFVCTYNPNTFGELVIPICYCNRQSITEKPNPALMVPDVAIILLLGMAIPSTFSHWEWKILPCGGGGISREEFTDPTVNGRWDSYNFHNCDYVLN